MEGKKERLSKFELMRLASMFLIVLWHTTLHSTLYVNASGFLRFLLDIVMCFCLVHVNSLVLLTGYFQCSKKVDNGVKVLKVMGDAWFYKVVIMILFYIFGIESISRVKIFQELMPIDFNNYWFICNYIVLFLMSPYLNRIVNYCNQKELKRFVLVLFTTLSIVPVVTGQAAIANDGFGVIHFIFLYFIGAYLRRYPIRTSYHFKNINDTKYRDLIIFAFISLGILNIVLSNFGDVLRHFNVDLLTYIGSLLNAEFLLYSAPIPVLMSILYFLFFETLSIKSRMINHFAATTFGIYLIHDNSFVRRHIYKFLNVKSGVLSVSPIKGIVALFGYAIIIYLGCMVIEEIRITIKNIRKGVWKCPQKKQTPPAFLCEDEQKEEIKKTYIPNKKNQKNSVPKKEKNKDIPESFLDF